MGSVVRNDAKEGKGPSVWIAGMWWILLERFEDHPDLIEIPEMNQVSAAVPTKVSGVLLSRVFIAPHHHTRSRTDSECM